MFVVVSSAALPFDITPILSPAGSGSGVAAEAANDIRYIAPAHGQMSRAELLAAVAEADALITLLTARIDDELLSRAPRLKIVANFAVGTDNIDIPAATRRTIVVTNTPDVLTEATADFAFALLLAAARRLPEGDRLVRSGQWTGWEPGQLLGAPVHGRTLGIIGMGRIGQAVARRARGFDMPILYHHHSPHPRAAELHAALGAQQVTMDELLGSADFLSLHCPLTPATRHIIDARALAAMKPTAVLINTARGACIDEDALARALAQGHIAAAGLDVFAAEPAVHPGLMATDRAVLAPHAGSATTTARKRMAEICAYAVHAVLQGRRPPTVINPEVYP